MADVTVDITEATIRERLAADRKKASRLATWEEIEYLLGLVEDVRRINTNLHAEVYRLDSEVKQLRGKVAVLRSVAFSEGEVG